MPRRFYVSYGWTAPGAPGFMFDGAVLNVNAGLDTPEAIQSLRNFLTKRLRGPNGAAILGAVVVPLFWHELGGEADVIDGEAATPEAVTVQ